MQLKLAFMMLICAVSGNILAQETKPTPSYADYMRICVDTEEGKQTSGQFGSSVERAFSTAFCQCQYDGLPSNHQMTKRQFSDALLGCFNERRANPKGFAMKYLGRHDKIRDDAAAQAELAPVPDGERWRYFYKSKSYDYYYDAQSVKWDGRLATVIIKVKSDVDLAGGLVKFSESAIDCDKIQSSVLRSLEMRDERVVGRWVTSSSRFEAIEPRSAIGELFYMLCLPEIVAPSAGDVGVSVDVESFRMNPPRYPPAAARAGIEGTVILVIDVDAIGNVIGISVEKTSGNRDLDRAALEAARKWRFNPGWSGGQKVGGRVRVPQDFYLGDSSL